MLVKEQSYQTRVWELGKVTARVKVRCTRFSLEWLTKWQFGEMPSWRNDPAALFCFPTKNYVFLHFFGEKNWIYFETFFVVFIKSLSSQKSDLAPRNGICVTFFPPRCFPSAQVTNRGGNSPRWRFHWTIPPGEGGASVRSAFPHVKIPPPTLAARHMCSRCTRAFPERRSAEGGKKKFRDEKWAKIYEFLSLAGSRLGRAFSNCDCATKR